MKALFVAGTDTGVGKTLVTGHLARFLSEKGVSVITQKWIQTGTDPGLSSDIRSHLKLMNRSVDSIKEYSTYINPYKFRKACSPHLASKIENKRIDAGLIKKGFKFLSKIFDFVIVEGTGGALVPLNNKGLVIDIVSDLNLPVLLVAENRLGAINQTLLTIEALNKRKIPVLGIVFNNIRKEEAYILRDNPRVIKRLTRARVLGALSRQPSYKKSYKEFIPIGERITGIL